MIPKKIHYCWFGGQPKHELAEHCIASWKRIHPDFEITEWNESN
jgi:mannosyltransferase OCH1-like enzyme